MDIHKKYNIYVALAMHYAALVMHRLGCQLWIMKFLDNCIFCALVRIGVLIFGTVAAICGQF